MGVIEIILGRPREALKFFLSSVEAQPNSPRNWLGIIDSLIKLKAYENAKKAIVQAKRYCAMTQTFEKLERKVLELECKDSLNFKREKVISEISKQPQDLGQAQLQDLLDLYHLN